MIKKTDSLNPINQEFAKSMSYMLEQLDVDNKALSYLPFVLSDEDSNNIFTIFKAFSPTLFHNSSRLSFILLLCNGQKRM